MKHHTIFTAIRQLNLLELVERLAAQPATGTAEEAAVRILRRKRNSEPQGDLRTILLSYTRKGVVQTEVMEVE